MLSWPAAPVGALRTRLATTVCGMVSACAGGRLFGKRPFCNEPMRTISFLPYGMKGRRAWFFYELLTGRSLDMPDATGGNAIDALDATGLFHGKAAAVATASRARQSARDGASGLGISHDEAKRFFASPRGTCRVVHRHDPRSTEKEFLEIPSTRWIPQVNC